MKNSELKGNYFFMLINMLFGGGVICYLIYSMLSGNLSRWAVIYPFKSAQPNLFFYITIIVIFLLFAAIWFLSAYLLKKMNSGGFKIPIIIWGIFALGYGLEAFIRLSNGDVYYFTQNFIKALLYTVLCLSFVLYYSLPNVRENFK